MKTFGAYHYTQKIHSAENYLALVNPCTLISLIERLVNLFNFMNTFSVQILTDGGIGVISCEKNV